MTCDCICREEAEKRNVWVAWLNLEARHGDNPQEAVMALFRRALPYTDPERLYLALLSILEASQMVRSSAATCCSCSSYLGSSGCNSNSRPCAAEH